MLIFFVKNTSSHFKPQKIQNTFKICIKVTLLDLSGQKLKTTRLFLENYNSKENSEVIFKGVYESKWRKI